MIILLPTFLQNSVLDLISFYVQASTRSKVNPIPKKAEAKVNAVVAPAVPAVSTVAAAPQKQAAMTENANAKSEFESGPGAELDAMNAPDPFPPMEVELGPPKENSAMQQPLPDNTEPIHENFEGQREEQPALSKFLLQLTIFFLFQ